MKSEENIALIKQELSDFKIDLGSIKELLDVKVTTAKKLTVDEYQSISAILTEKLGRDIFLNKNVDPSILGGIIVQIGDKVYDASALRKLKKMEVVMNGIDVHDYALEKPEESSDDFSCEVTLCVPASGGEEEEHAHIRRKHPARRRIYSSFFI